jgi:ABC-type uncharacterized transport system auxiliary subunit
MRRRAALSFAAVAWLAGCVSINVGSADAPALTFYVLADARPAKVAAPSEQPFGPLAIQGVAGDPLADSIALVFSRRDGERAVYQFASWSERPSRRLAQLAQQRLEAGGRFASVTLLGQPIAADWLLSLTLDTLVHDVSASPGRAQLALRAELINRRDRSLVASRTFAAAPPVAEATAPAAVAAFGTAVADVLDPLTAWVEAAVAAHRGR